MTEKDKPWVGVGVGVLITKNEKILLGKRHDDPAKASSALKGAGTWTMPGGKLEFGESFEEAAIRETLEETGLELRNIKLIGINNDKIETAHFVTIGLSGEIDPTHEPKVMEPERITEWKWFSLDDLPQPIFFPSARVLENVKRNQIYIKE